MTVHKVMQEIKSLKEGFKAYTDAANEALKEDNVEEANNFILESEIILFKIKKLEGIAIKK